MLFMLKTEVLNMALLSDEFSLLYELAGERFRFLLTFVAAYSEKVWFYKAVMSEPGVFKSGPANKDITSVSLTCLLISSVESLCC